jgi:Sulfotransferase family
MKNDSLKRIFIVGSPRSGTTLLQSMLAAHPDINSFPESHFFKHLSFNQRRWKLTLGMLGIAPTTARQQFRKFFHQINQNEMQKFLPPYSIFRYQYSRAFVKALDSLTKQKSKTIWIEKTPGHLYCIDCIRENITDAKFIHILRSGIDVVASQYEVTHSYPDVWGGKRSIDDCIQRWIKDLRISKSHLHQSDTIIVTYEDLLKYPDRTIKRICEFIEIDFDESMICKYNEMFQSIVLSNETWKSNNKEKILDSNSEKFYKIFDKSQQSYIVEKLKDFTIDEFSVMKG